MTYLSTIRVAALSGLAIATSITLGGWNAHSWAQPLSGVSRSFIDWLTRSDNPDADDDPRTKRGDEICMAAFAPDIVQNMWRDRPVFVVQGIPRSLALYEGDATDPFWTYPVNQADLVPYSGSALTPGTTYTLRASHPDFPSTRYEERPFIVLSEAGQENIATDLLMLQQEMTEAGGDAEAIALARADYFWQQGLETEAWAEIMPLQGESAEVTEAVEMALENLCGSSESGL